MGRAAAHAAHRSGDYLPGEGSTACALRAGLHQAHRRPLSAGRDVLEGAEDLQASAGRQRRGVNDQDVSSASRRCRYAAQQLPSLALATASGVTLAGRVLLARERDAGRDAVGAERALEPGRIPQLADGDLDVAVSLLGNRPGRLCSGCMAGPP